MIILVRHGQTAANAGGRLQGRSDLPLSDLGAAQAAALAGALRTCGATRVVSSPLARARATAAPIAAALECAVEVDDDLIELDYGEWDGRALADVAPRDWAAWRADPNFAPPGGESLSAVRARVERWLRRELVDSGPSGRDAGDDFTGPGPVVAVSHVSPIKAAICVALGVDDNASWRMFLDVASVSRLALRQGSVVLASFNETPAAHARVPHWVDGGGERPEA